MASSFRPDWSGRLSILQSSLARHRVDALVVSTPLNLTYLTGFTGSAGLLVVAPERVSLITDGRYDLVVRQGIGAGSLAPVALARVATRYDRTLAEVLTAAGASHVGFEPAHVTVGTLGQWQRACPGVTWVPLERTVERLRLIKDRAEIDVFRRGAALISRVAEALPGMVAVGRTEREVADRLGEAILRAGFSRLAFPTIVATGPNSALPHAVPGDRPIARGDLVVLDFGGVLDGYCVDLTRMAAAGPVSVAAKSLFDAVFAAHAAAVQVVRPGIQTSEVDRAARTVLESRGLGDAFSHSTGHGLGLEVHEAPRVARADPESPDVLEPGMVFTIEPGAYVESIGGVRVEDDVLVTAGGCEVLTTASRDLLLV